MKLKNKRTGKVGWLYERSLMQDMIIVYDLKGIVGKYTSLAELSDEWEDYEESKGSALDLMILTLINFIENEPDEDKVDLEDCKRMLEKLKAVKRLKDKGFEIVKWTYDIGDDHHKAGQIVLNLNNVRNSEWDEYDQMMEIEKDLDLLFSEEE